MNMRKIPRKIDTKAPLLRPVTERVLRLCLVLILLVTLATLFELTDAAPLTLAEEAHYALITEYLITTTALLTAGTYLLERVLREREQK